MKTEKMSFEKLKNVLSNTLSRDEMKEVMAGSGGGGMICGFCWDEQRAIGSYCYVESLGCKCPMNYALLC